MGLENNPLFIDTEVDPQLEKLTISVHDSAEALKAKRQEYLDLQEKKSHLQAQIDASGLPRRDIANVALSSQLDDVDSQLAQLEKKIKTDSINSDIKAEELDLKAKKRLH